MALVGMSPRANALDDEGRRRVVDAIVADSAGVVRPHGDAAGFAFEIGSNVTLART